MDQVTTNKRVKVKPTVAIRVADLKKLKGLSKEQQEWCDVVATNNPPGQVVHVDKEFVGSLQSKPGVKLTDEEVQG